MFLNLPLVQRPQLRVGFLTPSLGMGGAERWILSLTKHFRGAHTSIVGMVGENYHINLVEEMVRHAPVVAAMDIPGTKKLASRQAVAQKVINHCDIVVSWSIKTGEFYQRAGRPVIDVSHNDYDSPTQVKIAQDSWKGANLVVGISKASTEVYPPAVQRFSTTIYNGVEVDRVTPRKGRQAARETWGIPQDAKVLLFLGRLDKQKQPQRVVQILRHLPEDWLAIIVGDGKLRADVETRATEDAPGRVRFIPSSLHVGDYFAAADIYLLPSIHEGMPLTMLEAWLAGTPCVLSDFNCINELEDFHQRPLCWKVPKTAKPNEWIRTILEAYAAGPGAERVIDARSIAWSNYTAAAMAYRWEVYLTQVVQRWQDINREQFAVSELEDLLPSEIF
jgi:glycosyltransferase involved in cell wall biosynthesis